ncbi:uncharacterized protein FTJAE_13238 [Fusarium tjaetaba]|uniref:Myb-like domain-containing protein n=1 Tax=Fusarium tjaetaba TaxID=1567544 RepID=A0A8H5VBB6_9HYPO|nr:uncharacterized protein FTJAE_13238 [Fusarium tjaetaba]KAF5615770.1 hypothetical protein FTJAE_13238 [Fusarium tjaetaba]
MSACPSLVPAARAILFSLDLQLCRLFIIVLTISDTKQQDSLHIFTSPGHQVPLRNERAPSASGESTDNAIWISDDDSSDTEDEDDVENHDLNGSQSGYTTPTTASVVDHLNSMYTKHSETESDAAMVLSSDPESNQQALPPTTYTPTGDTTAGADTDSDILLIGPETQACLGASDGELVTKATGATSELDVVTVALSNEESCYRLQNVPVTPSELIYCPVVATTEVMAQTPLYDSKVRPGAERNDATPAPRSSSPRLRLLPESRPEQGQDHKSCSPRDTELYLLEAEFGSLPAARISPPFHKDSDADTEGSGSEDDLDVQECIHVEEYCPSLPDSPGHHSDSEDDSEELHCRKRRRVTRSQQLSTRRTAQLPKGRRVSVRGSESPALSQTSSVPSDAGTFARFEEWPLSNVFLKRITEGDMTTFQLQFDWTPDPSQPHDDRSISRSKEGRGPHKGSLSGTRSSGGKWTLEEENKVRTMRQGGCSWAEIRRALPHRSQGTI